LHNRIFCALLATVLGGCAVGPDFHRPVAPDATGFTETPLPAQTASADTKLGAAQQFQPGADIPAQWWTLFHSPALNAMIEKGLQHSPTIDAARAALRQGYELVRAQQGDYYPQLVGSFSPSRNLTPTGALSPASASGNPYYSLFTLQGNISYTPDVFGLTRRTVESVAAQAENARFQLEATDLNLAGNIAAAAILEASLRGQVAATQETIDVETRTLGILNRTFDLGQIAQADVVTQQAALAQAQLLLPSLQKQLSQQHDLLAVLVGDLPSDGPTPAFTLDQLQLPEQIPVSVPAQLVEQRPDVRAAEATLHAATAQVGIAVANRLPNITLSASGGYAANQIGQIGAAGTQFWSVGATLLQPVFEGFALYHKQAAAEAGLDEAAAQYRQAVLTAFQNVADSLDALRIDADGLRAAATAEAAALHSLQIIQRELDLGQIAYLNVLTAEQTYQSARLALVQAQAARLADTASLFQALGGGWWNRPAEGSDKPQGL
jgi:NodT family efflux transporter outer membrane factor (OMF) lipoprotein